MSGGGAGKVYFVLYLAVVLELLIIIVERDEAEEHLHAKQKEAMKMVESILSQLQAGSGTEGINTRPQDEITMRPDGMDAATIKEILGADIKSHRNYIIEVGVTDVSANLQQDKDKGESKDEYYERLKKLVSLANVQDIEFQIFFNRASNQREVETIAPEFFTDAQLKEKKIDVERMKAGDVITTDEDVSWEYAGLQRLELDNEATYKNLISKVEKGDYSGIVPVYKEPILIGELEKYIPEDIKENRSDSLFYYIHNDKDQKINDELVKKSFGVNFQPAKGQGGWYKLRFRSRTNRILGVKGDNIKSIDEVPDEVTVNIGTVQLKAKELKKVKKNIENDISKYGLPKSEDLIIKDQGASDFERRQKSEEFDKKIREAIAKAQKGESYEEDKVKIELYGYITRLLTPNSSRYFNQNSNSIEFDVRVVVPEPKQVAPQVAVNSYLHSFDEVVPSFMFSISPYQEGRNNIRGVVYNKGDQTGAPVAEITFQPSNPNAPAEGEARSYVGKVNKKLLAGNGIARQYAVKIIHELSGKQSDTTAILNVYPTLNEDEVVKLERQFNAFASYGNDFFFNFTPPSGRNVAADQFGYYFKTDADQQDRGLIPGLKAERSDNLSFPSGAKEASLKIVWVNPITKEEIAVFPEKTVSIKQAPPSIGVLQAQYNVAGDDVLSVRVSNLRVPAPSIGNGKTASVEFTSELSPSDIQVRGYSLVGKPTITKDGETYTVDFKLRGEPNDEGYAKGNVKLMLIAFAVNPENGVKSEVVRKPYNITINKKIETEDNFYDY